MNNRVIKTNSNHTVHSTKYSISMIFIQDFKPLKRFCVYAILPTAEAVG